jgi:virginiamycin B lyase
LRCARLAIENLEERIVLSPASYFEVRPFISSVAAGTAVAVTVRALDPTNMLDQSYTGQVGFSSSDGAAGLPAFYQFTAADHGVHTFPVTLRTAGRQTVTVTDTVQSNITGTAASTTEFLVPTPNSSPWGITVGPDNNLWFTEARKIGRITPGGLVMEFNFFNPNLDRAPREITVGSNSDLWFTVENDNSIGTITTAGRITGEFGAVQALNGPFGIAAGSDGALWFTEQAGNKIGRVPATGSPLFDQFTVPTSNSGPFGITAGPDGNLWFTELAAGKIGRITTAGMISEVGTPFDAAGITAGPDGNLWFTETSNKIGAITPGGITVGEFALPIAGSGPRYITAGPDGNLWFTEYLGNRIGQITTGGLITEFPVPTAGGGPRGITAGPDGNLWFTESNPAGNRIGRLIPGIDVTPAAADHLIFLQPPTDTAAGETISPPVMVAVVDQFGNVVTSDNTHIVTLSIGTDPSGGATLSGTLTVTVVNGVATFSDLSIDLAGDGYTLHATIGGGLLDIDTDPFSIT